MTLIKDFQYQSVTCKGEEMSESFIIITLWHFPLPLTLICGNILEYIITKDANQHGTHIANALGQLYILQIGFTCTRRAAATQTQHAASGQSRNIANIFASTVDHTTGYLIWEESRVLIVIIQLSRLRHFLPLFDFCCSLESAAATAPPPTTAPWATAAAATAVPERCGYISLVYLRNRRKQDLFT